MKCMTVLAINLESYHGNCHSKHAAPASDDSCDDPKNENSLSDESSSDSDFDLILKPCNKNLFGHKTLKTARKRLKASQENRAKAKRKRSSQQIRSIQEHYDGDILLQPPFAICKTCKKEFMSPESFRQHLKSARHAKKIAAAKLLENLRKEDGLQKLKEKHKKIRKAISVFVGDSIREKSSECLSGSDHFAEGASGSSFRYSSDDSSNEDMIADTQEFESQECKKIFSGVNPWYQHLISKSHEKKLKQKELMNQLKPSQKALHGKKIFWFAFYSMLLLLGQKMLQHTLKAKNMLSKLL
ncbi:c2H2-type domain-containing protein [Caerostris extrusa]|uniref:C2H2-type domain-containing protein n=1 Tax=Caerostris extrusa TaxID=172846 RepID=A0AAV4N5L0_CAEEX|nr:c2H2-type domain-containing protein [Caerostris extrusa]